MSDKVIGKIVLITAIVVSVVAWWVSFSHNYVQTYNDAASHLNIARRVVDSLTPGLAQIGTVWLPLPHLLMLLFAWNDLLWHTGFAGSIVSMSAYVMSVVFMYKTIRLVTEREWAAVVGTAVLGLNPNFLYLQTTAMTEPLLIATFVVAIYFLTKYLKTNAINDLILGSFAVSCATLVRYDGWFLFMSVAALLPFWIWRLRGHKRAESATILYLCAGGFGICLWLGWNKVIFGDPLYFMRGPYSAAAQQKVLKQVGQLPTQGSWYNAATYFMWSVIDNNGIWLAAVSMFGLVISPFIVKRKAYLFALIAVLTPIVFNVIALYAGQSAMNVPQASHDPGMFNIRYGIMALPAIALVAGVVSTNVVLRGLVVAVLLVQSVLFVGAGVPVSLADGLHGLKNTYYTVEASAWLKQHYRGGLILTSLASHDAFVARAGLPMKNYIHEGTREYWTNALNGPGPNVAYITLLTFPPDSVYRAIKNTPEFKNNYVQVHNYGEFRIYERKN
ncbi:glycosyltransferase family 39 protein [Candidatus Microgenomates bacterium]|nr:glycosyltransferase family 39 protein [Candidatus Microgenomates bacterium]